MYSLLIAALVGTVLPAGLIASADLEDFNLRTRAAGDAAELYGSQDAGPVVRGRTQPVITNARPETAYVPACSSNVGGGRIVDTALCLAATEQCEDLGQPDTAMYYLLTAPAGTARSDPGWTLTAQQVCRGADEPDEAPDPVMTLEDFRRLPIRAGRLNVQPASLRSLVNIETNFYVEAPVQVLPTELVGVPVQVRATPSEFVWSFGDGGTLATTDPGAPYPDLRTTHTYSRTGPMPVTLTTRYTGEYALPDGPWLPIPGQAEVASAPVTLTLLEARAELVDPAS